ncbi:hypothetical protein C1Y41_04140 [Pantoea sp. ICBG 1758]|uniref:M91 family zinc metallopeptidase n=1 Tax=Pantoea sp. ICBG 1758 TaxID=2071682 RepID=UPI000CE43674|nr:M91 family zinc metallopeptidase [Pantoea sp. ICBG 1758]PPC63841.1 hypothetical protein C1Y41_04140 [Pantoea sp. ICBG 1758]
MPYSITSPSMAVPEIDIHCNHSSEYEEADSALYKIKAGRNGNAILNGIRQITTGERRVHIMVNTDGISEASGMLTWEQIARHNVPVNPTDPQHLSKVLEVASKGESVIPVIFFNPNYSVDVDYNEKSWIVEDKEMAFISLAHELVHAYHLLNGSSLAVNTPHYQDPSFTHQMEEERALGINDFEGYGFSENGVRIDHAYPIRTNYFTEN